MKSVRGLVISRPITLLNTNGADGKPRPQLLIKPQLDPQELRSQLLFWDKLVHPRSLIPAFNVADPNAEEEYLVSAGVLERPTPSPNVMTIHPGLRHIEGHFGVFADLDTKEPGTWSLASAKAVEGLFIPDNRAKAGQGVMLSLYDCIPVPGQDVPLADILEFKEKRHDELVKLRHHLESIYQRISIAPDPTVSVKSEMEALDVAVADCLKVARESKIKWKLGGISAKIDTIEALGVGFATYQLGLGLAASAIAGIVAGKPKINLEGSAGMRDRTATGTPFQYVLSYHSELFRPL